MDVHIGELTSTIRAVDEDSVLAPAVMERIVAAVLKAVQDAEAHRKRVEAERRLVHGAFETGDED
jgi:hypothetical protein